MTDRNLLEETLGVMARVDLHPRQVSWVGTRDGTIVGTWEEFASLANFTYDAGFGGAEIATDLVIVFDGGTWLERGEYDGSEWWEFKSTPRQAQIIEQQPLTTVQGGLFGRLSDTTEDEL